MIPVQFPEANCKFTAPPGLDESQVVTVPAYNGQVKGGSMDGVRCVVVAWKPNVIDLERLNAGGVVFLSVLGGLPPHMLTTNFQESTKPQ